MTTEKEKIQSLRRDIEGVDDEILRLLNRRARIVEEVGKVKSEIKMDTYSPRREEEILQRMGSRNSGPFPRWAILSVFREIISACRALEAKLTVAFLGPPATFSHMACIRHFGSSIQMLPENTIGDVFEAVEREKADYGVVPVENSTEGPVSQTLDMLIKTEVKICAEIMTKVSHDLLSLSGDAGDIRKICSHPQALGQCREWLRENFPHVQLEEAGSTAKAAQLAKADPKTAAIAGSLAAHLYGLRAVASQIEDHLNNWTRFLVLGRRGAERTGRDKTSILLSISHAPGTLFRVLQVFYEKGINLTRIESRPMKGKLWEYLFFIDFEGHAADSNIAEALDRVKEHVLSVKLLGSYPQTSQERY
ncbi:MAG: prephenate dehydratase [Deltaproteobacteria bacterium RBG_13_53_10]|nr:MAG: prephenate dehydratase [Deltaproteobacteria bacterium RBG_13_53_10]